MKPKRLTRTRALRGRRLAVPNSSHVDEPGRLRRQACLAAAEMMTKLRLKEKKPE